VSVSWNAGLSTLSHHLGGVGGRFDSAFDSCLKDTGSNPAEAELNRSKTFEKERAERYRWRRDSNLYALTPQPREPLLGHCDQYCYQRICLSVRRHISGTTHENLIQFLCMLLMAVAQCTSGSVEMRYAIRYAFPVLRMTFCFRIMDPTSACRCTALWSLQRRSRASAHAE